MALSFKTLIRHNKNMSFGLVVLMMMLLSLLSGAVTLALSGVSPEFGLDIFIYGAGLGFCFSLLASGVTYFGGAGIISAISDARRIEHPDDPVLFNVVAEMAVASGLPMPGVYLIHDEAPNAFATGRDPRHAIVAITTGLRRKLSRDELQAVIAHEMAHIKNFDIRLMMLVAVYAGLIVLISDFFLRSMRNSFTFGGPLRRDEPRAMGRRGNLIILMVFILGSVLLAWLAPLIARFLQLAVSREREYLADATAVQFCRNPLALAAALKKIAFDPEQLRTRNRALEHLYIINPASALKHGTPDYDSAWATHPPLIKRIARLNALANEY